MKAVDGVGGDPQTDRVERSRQDDARQRDLGISASDDRTRALRRARHHGLAAAGDRTGRGRPHLPGRPALREPGDLRTRRFFAKRSRCGGWSSAGRSRARTPLSKAISQLRDDASLASGTSTTSADPTCPPRHGAFMEPSGRNQWQAPANRPAANRGNKPKPLPSAATGCRGRQMVRRRSIAGPVFPHSPRILHYCLWGQSGLE